MLTGQTVRDLCRAAKRVPRFSRDQARLIGDCLSGCMAARRSCEAIMRPAAYDSMVSTARKRALPLSRWSYASAARSSG